MRTPSFFETMVEQTDYTSEQLKKLGERIRVLRKKKYSSHEDFCYEHGFSRSQYWRYESGKDLRFSTLLRILEALNISVEEFFSEGFD